MMKNLPSMYPWDPARSGAKELLALMRQHRQDAIEIQIFYNGYVHELGVAQKNGAASFYLNEDSYASAFIFAATAAIEDMLFTDIEEPIWVLAIDGADPAEKLAK